VEAGDPRHRDKVGKPYSSCTDLEVVTTNAGGRGHPIAYNSCSGSDHHGPYDGFEEPCNQNGTNGCEGDPDWSYDFKLQNARPSPYCLYTKHGADMFPPNGNCLGYFPDEWMTFEVKIQTGPRVGNEWYPSFYTLWVGREGQPLEKVIEFGPYYLTAGDPAEDQKFGKVWLLPYMTNKPDDVDHPTAMTWYDDLVISTNMIPGP